MSRWVQVNTCSRHSRRQKRREDASVATHLRGPIVRTTERALHPDRPLPPITRERKTAMQRSQISSSKTDEDRPEAVLEPGASNSMG